MVIEAFSESFILGIIFAIIGCLLLAQTKSPMQAEQSIEKELDEVMKEDSPTPTNRTYSKDGIPELNNLIGLAILRIC